MEANIYTFMYCMYHDCGFIIKGYHKYVPSCYYMEHSNECESCDWYNMGVILYTGSFIRVIERVRLDYSRYGGGYNFSGYINTLTDEKGNKIDIDDDSILYKWIEEKSNNTIDTFLE